MTDEGVRHFFAGIPGMHGLTEAALSGWSGTVRILPAGAVLAVGDFMICGGEPGERGRQTLACMMAEQPREWLLYVPGKWKALLDGLGTFRPVTRQGFQLLQPDAIREDLVGWKLLPPGYTLASMDRADAEACLTADWSRDFVREHGSVEQFCTGEWAFWYGMPRDGLRQAPARMYPGPGGWKFSFRRARTRKEKGWLPRRRPPCCKRHGTGAWQLRGMRQTLHRHTLPGSLALYRGNNIQCGSG